MDRILTINSLVGKGVVSPHLAGIMHEAPDEVLSDLDRLPKQNAVEPKTLTEAVAAIPEPFRGELTDAIKVMAEQKADDDKSREALVNALKGNARCKIAEPVLKTMTVEQLVGVAQTLTSKGVFHGAGSPGVAPELKANVATGADGKEIQLINGVPVAPALPGMKDA